jgi:hypothetical protein
MVKALHAAGIEVILDVVYNHTAEGNHLGPTLSLPRHRQPAYYRLVDEDDPRYYMDYTGTGNTLNVRHPARAAADHGLAALLGHRDARRRLPLRPRLDAGPRVPRGRPAVGVLRPRAAGPGRQPGEADRRAVGRRARAATRSATSRRCGPSGTASTATRARLLARGAPARSASSLPAHRLSDLYEDDGRAPVRSINFVTAHDGFTLQRPGLLQRQAQRGQRRGQPRRRPTTTGRGTAASRARPTTPRSSRCASGSSATSWPRCCCPGRADERAGRADAARTATSSAAPRAATTTPTARTTRAPHRPCAVPALLKDAVLPTGQRPAAPGRSTVAATRPPMASGHPGRSQRAQVASAEQRDVDRAHDR